MFYEQVGNIVAIVIALVGAGANWGLMQAKINDLTNDINKLEEDLKDMVPLNHFEAVTEPLQQQISDIQKDIKSILLIVSKNVTYNKNKSID